MALDTYLKRVKKIIPASGQMKVSGVGELVFVESASGFFQLQADNRQPIQIKSRFKIRMQEFRDLTITNESSTNELTVVLWIARGDVDYNEIVLPQTVCTNFPIDLANNANVKIPGIDSDGRRRKQLTITLRPSLAQNVQIYDGDPTGTGLLLAIIGASSSGGGFAIETDGDVWLKNVTGGAIVSTGAAPDIGVMQTFYV